MPFNDDLARSPSLTAESPPGLPPGFDPRTYPVIAAHFYGLTVLPRPDAGAHEASDVGRAA